MKLVSVNVGLPREVEWKGRTVSTGIFKSPVDGPVALHQHNLAGDRQADLSVHGGPTKAVYAYSAQHYEYWRSELSDPGLSWGAFGENFTIDGGDEETIHIGDEFQIGTARVVVTEPRVPCYKLGIRFDRADMVRLFLESQRSGFYFGVVEEGVVEAGDTLERVFEHPARLSVADVTRIFTNDQMNEELLRKAVSVEALPEKWRYMSEHYLELLTG